MVPVQTLRLFIAIELTPEVHLALAQLQDTLKRQLPPKAVRWTKPDGIHLTLKFLGDTPQDKVQAVVQGMTAAVAGFAPFEFQVSGFGCFPNPRKARCCGWVCRNPPRPWPACNAPSTCTCTSSATPGKSEHSART